MRKLMLTTILVFSLFLGYAVVQSHANDMMEERWEMTQETQEPLGATVKNREGEFLGVITDFAKDSENQASFAILLFGNYEDYGEDGRHVAVPFSSLSCSGNDCVLDSSYAQLASSPIFGSKDELVNREFAENIYRYYGLQPPWTEEDSTEYEMSPDVPSYDYDY